VAEGDGQGDEMMEAVKNVFVGENDDNMRLRGRRARAHLPCQDRVEMKETSGAPVPAVVLGDFTVRLGDVMPAYVLEELEEEFDALGGAEEDEVLEGLAEAVSGFLSWMHWVEAEVGGLPDVLEGLARLKGAVMGVGAAMEGEL
jgi:hypothetical protein